MSRLYAIGLLLLTFLPLALVGAQRAAAQDDPDEIPLGDVARNVRKRTPPAMPVIDDDNLSQVMQEADGPHDLGQGLRFLMSGKKRGFQVEVPDVTCSLSFSANVKSLLAGQYSEMELPPTEMAKVEGKAVIEGDALTVSVFNATQWHLSEITVAFTVVRKGRGAERVSEPDSSAAVPAQALPALNFDAFQQVRPEKSPDVTVIYRMRAAALPWSNAVFSAPLDLNLAPSEDWHWALVKAKGYPPETYVSAAKPNLPASEPLPSAISMKSAESESRIPAVVPPPQ